MKIFKETSVSLSRSAIMRRVGRQNTKPELIVRSRLHALGLRFRLHRRDLPGSPDRVLSKYRTAIFVHGCFWHRHTNCEYTTPPKTRQEFWLSKFEANMNRDERKEAQLQELGWKVLVVWECETRALDTLEARLRVEFGMQLAEAHTP
ncbi:very short patch repair endonuclease [Pseudomonas marginalis]|uniref:very short patch repair endonuclease n=1 Tax=Pseudomonas marginalis TaxID=298 RepID=UPI0026465D81|nr:very short patch repair endonuclease [Pseudomonas marginalis]